MIGRTISHYEIAQKLGEGEVRNGHCGRRTFPESSQSAEPRSVSGELEDRSRNTPFPETATIQRFCKLPARLRANDWPPGRFVPSCW